MAGIEADNQASSIAGNHDKGHRPAAPRPHREKACTPFSASSDLNAAIASATGM